MALFSKDIGSLEDLFTHTLRDMYYAENKIVKSLPGMISKASDSTLKKGLEEHLAQTRNHVTRLDKVFGQIGAEPKSVDCPAIDGIIEEADDVIGNIDDKDALDAAIIAAAQAVEHYEISRYGTLKAWALKLNNQQAAKLLDQTLAEEKKTDDSLTKLAETAVNYEAAAQRPPRSKHAPSRGVKGAPSSGGWRG